MCLEVCKYQMDQSKFSVFEHPAESTPREILELKGIKDLEGVHAAEFDMCRYGLVAKDDDGVVRPVRKARAC